MALINSIPTEYGIDFPEAYHRIVRVTVDNGVKSAYVDVEVFASSEARANPESRPVQTLHYHFPLVLGDANVIQQAYDYLKTLEGYKNGVDA